MLLRKVQDVLGFGKGGAVRSALETLWASLVPERTDDATPPHQDTAFTIALVALAAKMAKADGIAVTAECEAFGRWFQVPPEQRSNVFRVYNLAKQDVAGYETYADQLGRLLKSDKPLLRDVFECLFHIATSDGVLHEDEERFLATVAGRFGLPDGEFDRVRRLFVIDPRDPYRLLDISPEASDADIKARHRQLVRENHPDRLAADGVPEQYRVFADRKLASINAAYDVIRRERDAARSKLHVESAI